MNHIHVRIHRWVIWWLFMGVVCGAVALLNILLRDLTHTQEKAILAVGIVNWVLGGIVCWASEGIKIQVPPQPERHETRTEEAREWHPPSDFVLPGGRKSLLPPKY